MVPKVARLLKETANSISISGILISMTNDQLPMANDQILNSNEITQSSDIVTSESRVGRPRKFGKALDG